MADKTTAPADAPVSVPGDNETPIIIPTAAGYDQNSGSFTA